jgi:predicted N-acetyltransferase YhbS
MPISIHPLVEKDVEGAAQILSLAFQRSSDWVGDLQLYRKIQPDGYIVAKMDEAVVGMVGATIYPDYAYVGMMAVHPANQRQGVGAALMRSLLTWLDRHQVPVVRLDASSFGQPLYERLGFVPYESVEIFQRGDDLPACVSPSRVKPLTISDLERVAALDAQAFGTDRSRVLRLLMESNPGRAFFIPDGNGNVSGYLITQKNRIGPWVMQNGEDAEALLQAALSLPVGGQVSVTVPGENKVAADLLRFYGFRCSRANRHMGKGTNAPAGQREMVFSQASLSLG